MTILLLVGVALVLFGAVVLLRFPDRPGGKIAWQGFEVSSLGAGLPLIVVGVVAIGLASVGVAGSGETRPQGADSPQTGEEFACFDEVPEDELRAMEAGASNFILVRPDQPKGDPLWIAFTDGGEPLGGLRYRFFPANELFRIERLVDARCEPLEPVELPGSGSDPNVLQNSDTVRLRFGAALYDLRLIASSDIRANFVRVRE